MDQTTVTRGNFFFKVGYDQDTVPYKALNSNSSYNNSHVKSFANWNVFSIVRNPFLQARSWHKNGILELAIWTEDPQWESKPTHARNKNHHEWNLQQKDYREDGLNCKKAKVLVKTGRTFLPVLNYQVAVLTDSAEKL